MAEELDFSGKKFYVQVNQTSWTKAKTTLGMTGMPSATEKKECCVVSKLIDASGTRFNATFRAPTHADHDVIIVLDGHNHTVDIKVLYPDVGLTLGNASETDIVESLVAEMNSAWTKEKKQGNVCLFDLSYIGDARRQKLAGGIHNTYPACLTLEYDMNNSQLHLIWPAQMREVHIGTKSATWYH